MKSPLAGTPNRAFEREGLMTTDNKYVYFIPKILVWQLRVGGDWPMMSRPRMAIRQKVPFLNRLLCRPLTTSGRTETCMGIG